MGESSSSTGFNGAVLIAHVGMRKSSGNDAFLRVCAKSNFTDERFRVQLIEVFIDTGETANLIKRISTVTFRIACFFRKIRSLRSVAALYAALPIYSRSHQNLSLSNFTPTDERSRLINWRLFSSGANRLARSMSSFAL